MPNWGHCQVNTVTVQRWLEQVPPTPAGQGLAQNGVGSNSIRAIHINKSESMKFPQASPASLSGVLPVMGLSLLIVLFMTPFLQKNEANKKRAENVPAQKKENGGRFRVLLKKSIFLIQGVTSPPYI